MKIKFTPNKNKAPLATKSIRTPEGVIRPGTRKPFRKATRIEVEERVELIAAYMRVNPLCTKWDIHRKFVKKFNIHYAHLDQVYVPRAREILVKQAKITKDQAKEVGVNLILTLLSHHEPKVRLAAEKRLAEIYGYNAPTRIESSGPDGGPIQVEERPLEEIPSDRLRTIVASFGKS